VLDCLLFAGCGVSSGGQGCFARCQSYRAYWCTFTGRSNAIFLKLTRVLEVSTVYTIIYNCFRSFLSLVKPKLRWFQEEMILKDLCPGWLSKILFPNRPFLNFFLHASLNANFFIENEMSFTCKLKLFFIWMVVHQASLWKSSLGQLENGLFPCCVGLCPRSARVPQSTNFCLWAVGKTYYFHTSVSAGHPGY